MRRDHACRTLPRPHAGVAPASATYALGCSLAMRQIKLTMAGSVSMLVIAAGTSDSAPLAWLSVVLCCCSDFTACAYAAVNARSSVSPGLAACLRCCSDRPSRVITRCGTAGCLRAAREWAAARDMIALASGRASGARPGWSSGNPAGACTPSACRPRLRSSHGRLTSSAIMAWCVLACQGWMRLPGAASRRRCCGATRGPAALTSLHAGCDAATSSCTARSSGT